MPEPTSANGELPDDQPVANAPQPTSAPVQITPPQPALQPLSSQPNATPLTINGKTIHLTDALRNGIMLRDNRLTLRHNSAFTPFLVEAAQSSSEDFLLKCPINDNRYVQVGGKDAFKVDGNQSNAQRFRFVVTDLGRELYVVPKEEKETLERPGVFDDFYDVSIGKAKTGRSYIPILVHVDVDHLSAVWGQGPV